MINSCATILIMDENTQFVPLHLHSEFSLLDGAIKLKDLCKFAKENNMPAVAITDHGVMYGALDLYLEAKEEPAETLNFLLQVFLQAKEL